MFGMTTRTQDKDIRAFVTGRVGAEVAATMCDGEVEDWLDANGYRAYLTCDYGCADDSCVLIAKEDAVNDMVERGDAFFANRR